MGHSSESHQMVLSRLIRVCTHSRAIHHKLIVIVLTLNPRNTSRFDTDTVSSRLLLFSFAPRSSTPMRATPPSHHRRAFSSHTQRGRHADHARRLTRRVTSKGPQKVIARSFPSTSRSPRLKSLQDRAGVTY
jgi:hypothetical protein